MAVEEILADYEDLDREDLLGIRLRHASQSDQAHKAHSLIKFSPRLLKEFTYEDRKAR
jgi:hypothetical protein